MPTNRYRVIVDGKAVTMLATPGTTLDQAKESARVRFGSDRVSNVKPITASDNKREK